MRFPKFDITIGPSKTCWWINDRHPQRVMRVRQDHLFGIFRLYSRVAKMYSWQVIIGRIKVEFWFE